MMSIRFPSRGTGLWPVWGLSPMLAMLLAGCAGPQWVHEYNFGQQLASEKSKPMLLYFADFMSSEHRALEHDVIQTRVVQQELAGCVNVYLAYQWGPAPRQYNVHSPHILVLCQPDGTEVDRLVANPTPAPETLAKWLHDAKSKATVVAAGAQKPGT